MARPNRSFGYGAYRAAAPQSHLDQVITFYDRALRHIEQARQCDLNKMFEAEYKNAQEAIVFLHALDSLLVPTHRQMYDLLHNTYQSVIRALYSAAIRPDGAEQYARLHEALLDLRQAWVEARSKSFVTTSPSLPVPVAEDPQSVTSP